MAVVKGGKGGGGNDTAVEADNREIRIEVDEEQIQTYNRFSREIRTEVDEEQIQVDKHIQHRDPNRGRRRTYSDSRFRADSKADADKPEQNQTHN
ncbi:hypothetical protein Tco_1154019 [Tanacetum coccineum]